MMSSNKAAEEENKIANELIKSNLEDSYKHYSNAISLNPREPKYYTNRAFVSMKQNRFEDALQDCHESLRVQPSWTKGYLRSGEILISLGKTREATLALRKGIDQCESGPILKELEDKLREQLHVCPD